MLGNKVILNNRKTLALNKKVDTKRKSEVLTDDHVSLPSLSIKERNFKSSFGFNEILRRSSLKLTDSQ